MTDFFGYSVDKIHDLLYKNNMEVHLNGGVKFQMMMMGRSGYNKNWCLYCRKIKSEWTTHHSSNEFDVECSSMFSLWNTQDVNVATIRRDQDIVSYRTEGKTEKQGVEKFKSAGVKEPCLWPFIPVTRHVLHVLHILLGL